MKKILGLDVGEKRIGVALAEDNLTAIYGIVKNHDLGQAINEIRKIYLSEDAKEIVIGIPKNKDNLQTDKIHKFAQELAKNLNTEIFYIDERLTSKEAERILAKQKIDPKSKEYKEEIDKIAAKLILEQFLSQ